MGKIHITRHDLERFQPVVDIQNGPEAPFIEKPKKELYRATILEPTNVPGDVVTMNSIVRVRNINTAGERAFLLAFPGKTGSKGRAVSILSPIGIALPATGSEMSWNGTCPRAA
ncbi:MAG: GreA/GreB family elongation factor [Syntrophorhabdaceae bacterium]|nr:GreA/GreB family elongation factor [Syntrophorhabdaceae bacterium]